MPPCFGRKVIHAPLWPSQPGAWRLASPPDPMQLLHPSLRQDQPTPSSGSSDAMAPRAGGRSRCRIPSTPSYLDAFRPGRREGAFALFPVMTPRRTPAHAHAHAHAQVRVGRRARRALHWSWAARRIPLFLLKQAVRRLKQWAGHRSRPPGYGVRGGGRSRQLAHRVRKEKYHCPRLPATETPASIQAGLHPA